MGASSSRALQFELAFVRDSGRLVEIRNNDRVLPLSDGPRVVAYRRETRAFVPIDARVAFDGIPNRHGSRRGDRSSDVRRSAAKCYVVARRWSDRARLRACVRRRGRHLRCRLRRSPGEQQALGPRRTLSTLWQNDRQVGRHFDVRKGHLQRYCDGRSHAFTGPPGSLPASGKLALKAEAGSIVVENASGIPAIFSCISPTSEVSTVLELPDVGFALLSVIPAMSGKFILLSALSRPSHRSQRRSVPARAGTPFP